MKGLPARQAVAGTWSDRYVRVFGLVVLAAMLAQPVTSTLSSLARHADPARAGAGLALVVIAYAGLLALARSLGPIVLPAADAAWLVLSPLHRRTLLSRSAAVLLALCVLAGLGLGVALLAVVGGPDQVALRVVGALALGVCAAVSGTATTVLAQASAQWDSWLRWAIVALVIAAVVAAVLGVGAAPAASGAWAAGVWAVVTAFLVRRAWAGLERIHARKLLSASTRAGQLSTAAVVMDLGALTWIAEDNHWRRRHLRSRPWPARLPMALAVAWQDWRRLARRPGRVAALVAAAALPALAAQAGGGLSTPVVVLVAAGAMTAGAACTTGARRDGDDPSLARLLAVPRRAILTARAALPLLLSALWLALALAALALTGATSAGSWWVLAVFCAPALAAGALRMARRRPVDHSMPVINTPAGAIPTGPLLWALTGVDLAVVGCLPALAAMASGPSGALLAAQAVAGTATLATYLFRSGR